MIWSDISGSNSPTFNQQGAIVPGLSIPLLVQYKPTSNASLNEILFIAVEGAGGLTVPLVACAEAPPILDCNKIKNYYILINRFLMFFCHFQLKNGTVVAL